MVVLQFKLGETKIRKLAKLLIILQTVFSWLSVSQTLADEVMGPFVILDKYPSAIFLQGEINLTSPLDLRRAIAASPDATLLVLSSPGGLLASGLVLADAVAASGLVTWVPEGSGCYSSCTYIFFAGTERLAQGELGVHQMSGSGDIAEVQSMTSEVVEALRRFDVPDQVLTRMLRTPSSEVYVFAPDEIAAINRIGPRLRAFLGEPATSEGPSPLSVPASAPVADEENLAQFTQLQASIHDAWRAVRYRNNRSGQIFCALESLAETPLFRINFYLADNDTFLEIFDPTWQKREGSVSFNLEFTGEKGISAELRGTSDGVSYTHDFLEQRDLEVILGLLSSEESMRITSSNGGLVATYDLVGSAAAIRELSACIQKVD